MNSKEFYEFLVPNSKTDFHKKVYKKLYSLVSKVFKGKFEVTKDKGLIISGKINNHLVTFNFAILREGSTSSRIPTKITPTKIKFDSGYLWHVTDILNYQYIKINGEYQRLHKFENILELINFYSNIEGFFYSYRTALKDATKSYPVNGYWVKCSNEWSYKNFALCLKPFFIFKRGDIFDLSAEYRQIQTFESVYDNNYPTFQKYSVNLSGDIPKPPSKEVCQKSKFGCTRACLRDCLVKSKYKKNKELYKLFLKWKKLMK